MIRVFCDFDGTVASADVGNALFRTFSGGRTEAIVAEYLQGSIDAPECFRRECEAIGTVSRAELGAFVDSFDLDPGFPSFVSFCREQDMPLMILSDGLDFYVKRILDRHGFGMIPFKANKAVFHGDGDGARLSVEFPYRDEHCDRCGNCKKNHLATLSADEDVIVYVGDGFSDRCAVRHADIVFAKKRLIAFCQEENISYHEYRDFNDVRGRLERMLAGGEIRQRREAVMARRALFVAE